ncbi:MAG TPA: sigma-70 family RNA polymerase sigma factor [Pyrinomonadaceae bacterium]|nr:sigma-70 family RNA polymerase sigma factor [Pyrinomonadaceae bacterium]
MSYEVAGIAYMTDEIPTAHASAAAAEADASSPLSSLAERARAGETAAFEQLMTRTQHGVAATAWRLLGNREDARDATQETYLRAYKYLHSYRAEQDFQGWLYRVTVNVCRDMLRAGRGASNRIDSFEDERAGAVLDTLAAEDDTEQAALLAQRRAIVGRALATLPEKERTAVVLRDLEGLSTEEVARVMKTRPATVRSQVSTGRAKLKLYCERLLRRDPPPH